MPVVYFTNHIKFAVLGEVFFPGNNSIIFRVTCPINKKVFFVILFE